MGQAVTRGTTRRTVRIEDELWDLAQAKAKEQGDNLSAIIRDALRQYVQDNQEEQQ